MRLRPYPHRTSNPSAIVGCAVGLVVLSGALTSLVPEVPIPAPSGPFPLPDPLCVGDNPFSYCRAAVMLSSDAACAPPPAVNDLPPAATRTLQAPGGFIINATEFCGTSMFYDYTTTGAVSVVNGFGYDLGAGYAWLTVYGNGTVAANYVTEPSGLYPVMFVWEDWAPSSSMAWTAHVGEYSASSEAKAGVVAVPNGTYAVSVTGSFCGPEGLPRSIGVHGTGVRLPFQGLCALPSPASSPATELPPYGLVVLPVAAYAGTVLAIVVLTRADRRRV